jgi:hypothetical protein
MNMRCRHDAQGTGGTEVRVAVDGGRRGGGRRVQAVVSPLCLRGGAHFDMIKRHKRVRDHI